jgi:hypothetical protein
MLSLLADPEAAAQALSALKVADFYQAGSGEDLIVAVTATPEERRMYLRHVPAVARAMSWAGLDASMVTDLLVPRRHAKGAA